MSALSIVFWGYLFAVVVHIMEESLLGGSFVEKVKQHFWPEYDWRKFFWFNTGAVLLTFLSCLLYDTFGGHWVIFPLAWAVHYVCNGCFHIWWAVHYREYSPGLLTSTNYFALAHFLVQLGVVNGAIAGGDLTWGIGIGILMGLFTSFGTPIAGKIAARKRTRAAM
jgi:hypothetical protein